MLNIKMSKEDYSNLKIFLDRVNLTGKETLAFVSIMQKLSEAKPCEECKKEVR